MKQDEAKKRSCLTCGAKFISQHIWNRICFGCARGEVFSGIGGRQVSFKRDDGRVVRKVGAGPE